MSLGAAAKSVVPALVADARDCAFDILRGRWTVEGVDLPDARALST